MHEERSDMMFKSFFNEYFKQILDNCKDGGVIFVHNLGSFDGVYLLKHLVLWSEAHGIDNIKAIIDDVLRPTR